jgi:CRP/FNR family transcriptional regulator, anaerobic regulatory protein
MTAIPLHKPVGTILFRAGDECPGYVAVTAGCIRVSLVSANGREIVLYRVGPGEVCLQTFACLVEGRRYLAEGVVEAEVSGELIPPNVFSHRMATDDAFRQQVLGAVAHRFAEFEHVVETLAFAGLEQRVAQAILRVAGAGREARITHEQIAIEIGSAREAVSRQIAALARTGFVAAHRGVIEILDRNGLSQLAAAPV